MEVKSGKSNLFTLAQQASAETKVTVEKKAKAQLAPIVAVIAEKKTPAGATSVKAENQMTASAQQAKLSNQLDRQFPTSELFAQKKAAKNADSPGGARVLGDPSNRIDESRGRKARPIKPLIISTGPGNDQVDILMEKGRIYVKVNGKVAWSGTPEEFKKRKVTINTGAGVDDVYNEVDGARIETGKDTDYVVNYASNTRIDTGDGNDTVLSGGYRQVEGTRVGEYRNEVDPSDGNVITTGSGNDTVTYMGSNNRIFTGDDNDTVASGPSGWSDYGQGNIIYTGHGDDRPFTHDAVIDPDECYDPDKD